MDFDRMLEQRISPGIDEDDQQPRDGEDHYEAALNLLAWPEYKGILHMMQNQSEDSDEDSTE